MWYGKAIEQKNKERHFFFPIRTLKFQVPIGSYLKINDWQIILSVAIYICEGNFFCHGRKNSVVSYRKSTSFWYSSVYKMDDTCCFSSKASSLIWHWMHYIFVRALFLIALRMEVLLAYNPAESMLSISVHSSSSAYLYPSFLELILQRTESVK